MLATLHSVTINHENVSILLNLLIPFLMALVVKEKAPAQFKAVMAIILSAAYALIIHNYKSDGTALISGTTLFDALQATAITILSYIGVYKHFDINGNVLPEVGVGPTPPTPIEVSVVPTTPAPDIQ